MKTEKIYILKWLRSGHIANIVYSDRKEANRVAKRANEKRTRWHKMFTDTRWAVLTRHLKVKG